MKKTELKTELFDKPKYLSTQTEFIKSHGTRKHVQILHFQLGNKILTKSEVNEKGEVVWSEDSIFPILAKRKIKHQVNVDPRRL